MNRTVALSIVVTCFAATAFVPAREARAQAADDRSLQALVNDTAFQLKLTHRHNATELAKDYSQLNAAVAAWNESARGEADNRRLAEWLRGAIKASMPGSTADLPEVPRFDPKPKPAPRVTPERTEELPTPAARRDRPVTQASAESRTNAAPVLGQPASEGAHAPETTNQQPEEKANVPSEQTLMRPASVPADDDHELDLFNDDPTPTTAESEVQAPVETSPTGEASVESVEDFWSSHPASGELPAELSSGDPFQDDPVTAEE